MAFVHLHGHSTFSFLEAIGLPKEISQKAKELDMSAIAITDYRGMYGAINFYQSAKQQSINPIIGVEVGFVVSLDGIQNPKQIGNVCLLAKNKVGYYNLLKLTSYANTLGLENIPKIDISSLQKRNEGIIAFMGGPNSWIGNMLLRNEKPDKIQEIIQLLKDAIGSKNVFLEIIAQDHSENIFIKKVNEKILTISQNSNTEIIVDNTFNYINKEDKDAREMALAIKDGYKMYDEQRRKPKGQYHIASESEIREILNKNNYQKSQIDTRIQNTVDIANQIDIEIDLHQSLFPNYSTPEDIKQLYDKHKDELIENI